MDNTKEYFVDEWSFNRVTNSEKGYMSDGGKVIAYTKITEEFQQKLDSMYDNGSALITNAIKEFPILSCITGVDRVSDCITISFEESDKIWESDNDTLQEYIDKLFQYIIGVIELMPKWPPEPNVLYGLYSTGTRYMPDSMFGMIKDVGIQYDTNRCIYAVLLTDEIYNLVGMYIAHFKDMMKGIMLCKEVALLDKDKTLVMIDNNKGTGPSIDRANAIGCAVMFSILEILQLLELKEQCNE